MTEEPLAQQLASLCTEVPTINLQAVEQASQHQNQLTKPQGSLGRLEWLSIRLAGIMAKAEPVLQQPHVVIFAADHGITAQGVSAFPSAVTAQMVRNFVRGGGAINVLANSIGAKLWVVDMGVASDLPSVDNLFHHKLGYGTADFSVQPAMTLEQAYQSIFVGAAVAQDMIQAGADIILPGEMGIGNTTSASAIVATLTGLGPELTTGCGTGLDEEAKQHKVNVIRQALEYHKPNPQDPLDVLCHVGGFEIGGLVGAMLAAAAQRVPILLDGFIVSAAAGLACGLVPHLRDFLIPAHRSLEDGHMTMLEHLGLQPLLDIHMRLGEASGAAVAFPLCQMACALLNNMATFEQAGVSEKK